jgi:sulfur-carrier protein
MANGNDQERRHRVAAYVGENMAVTVLIPTPLRRLTGGANQARIDEAATLRECVASLEQEYPGFAARLLDDKGELRRGVNVYINGEDVRFLSGIASALKSGDEVSIVPAVAGG